MSFIKKIQNSVGKAFAGKEAEVRRDKKVYNYQDASSLAMIFKLETEDQYQIVRQYLKFIKEEHGIKELMALCYVDDKETPSYIQSRVDFEFFTKKELNWQQKPSGISVENFVDEPYNILIDLSEGDYAAVNFVVNASKANFKIGRQVNNENAYDLMISLPPGKTGLKDYIEQINHYLTLINRS